MISDAAAAGALHPANPRGKQLLLLSLAAVGVVYGDIGTSPLYALRECFHGPHAVEVTRGNVLGVLSLVFWALIVVISIKYIAFILRADNRGEGGILALSVLVSHATNNHWLLGILGLFGASLLYSDGMITPAISVLSAVEGLSIATPMFTPYVVPIAVAIIIGLFYFQVHGTAKVGAVFGPVMVLWFTVLGALGVASMIREPAVLAAVNPWHGVQFFVHNGWHGFAVLGAVFLVVTGGEALYADIGHFGTRPIRVAWFTVALPGLLLNYFGQGALLLREPAAASHPFFQLAPAWALYPMVGLAAAAAVIASQALICGAFSLTMQAVQLGFSPRLTIQHTSADAMGQIYLPLVNWGLMVCCILLVVGFGSSSNLAAAYGVSIASTMVITTVLFFFVASKRWRWPLGVAVVVCGTFILIDAAFLAANITKLAHGGWFPLLIATVAYTLMSTWRSGRATLAERLRTSLLPLDMLLADVRAQKPLRVPGTAVFMSGNPVGTPGALLHNLKHNKVLHERVVILTVQTKEVPHVLEEDRLEIQPIDEGFWRVVLRYGFMETPDVMTALEKLDVPGFKFRPRETSFFLGRETILPAKATGWKSARHGLFAWMSRNARDPSSFFGLPPNAVVELGAQVKL